MRKTFGALAAAFYALGIADPVSAVLLDFTGSLTIEFGVNRRAGNVSGTVKVACMTAVIPGSGAVAVNGPGARGHLTA